MYKLSILIPTTIDREKEFSALWAFLHNILDLHDFHNEVQLLYAIDNKEMSIGAKRQWLYEQAEGRYSWQIDSDDCIAADAIPLILEAIKEDADCITFQEKCIIDGVESISDIRLHYSDWCESEFGYDHIRTPFFKTPIKTEICRKVPVPDLRFGEDHVWAKAIKIYIQSETYIPKMLYYYTRISSDHNTRYGII